MPDRARAQIVKKHDKHSTISLSDAVMKFCGSLPFYQSTLLASSFTNAQCIASEIMAATLGSSVVEQSQEYTCGICLDLLNMPVVLSCAHRFCYGCLSRACLYDHHCPLCKKATDLDPSNYHIHPVLTKFVAAHFLRDGAEEVDTRRSPGQSLAKAHGTVQQGKVKPAVEPLHLACSDGSQTAFCNMSPSATGQSASLLHMRPSGASVASGDDLASADGASLGTTLAVISLPLAQAAACGPRSAQKKRACTECHRSKAACEGDPCVRCIRLGKSCVTIERRPRRRRTSPDSDCHKRHRSGFAEQEEEEEEDCAAAEEPLMPVPQTVACPTQVSLEGEHGLANASVSPASEHAPSQEALSELFFFSTAEITSLMSVVDALC